MGCRCRCEWCGGLKMKPDDEICGCPPEPESDEGNDDDDF